MPSFFRSLMCVELLAIGDMVSIDLFQNFFGAGLGVLAVGGVVPGKRSQAVIARARIVLRLALSAAVPKWYMNHVSLRASPGRIDSFLAVLQQALRVGEGAFLLRGSRRGKQENFSANRFG